MNKTLLTLSTLALLMLSGCGQPAPGGIGGSNISDADTVSIDEGRYGNNGTYNSSSDGFQSVYFNFDDYTVPGSQEGAISKDAANAQRVGGKIKVEGNCDEFGTDEYNYALGLKRAKAVKDSLVMQGIPASRMVLVSYGESNPACTAQTDACYAQNRRVDLRLVK